MCGRESQNGVGQVFAATEHAQPLSPPRARGNYLSFRHGTLRFGKLTMHDADLQLVDAYASDPFDFFPARYSAQLVAGYSKNTRSGGLVTVMPDYGRIERSPGLDLTRGLRPAL